MFWAVLLIAFLELGAAFRIIARYSKSWDIEAFIAQAPLDQFIRVQHHLRTFMLMFQFATIVSVLRTQ